jgi:hypothetical protein
MEFETLSINDAVFHGNIYCPGVVFSATMLSDEQSNMITIRNLSILNNVFGVVRQGLFVHDPRPDNLRPTQQALF